MSVRTIYRDIEALSGAGRADLRGGGPGRRRPPRRRLPHPPHRAHRRGGGGAGAVRAARARRRSSGSARCWPPPSSRSTPRSRRSCAAGPCGCASASTSTRPAGSPARSRSPTSPRSRRAVWEEQRVEIRYRKRDGEVKRLLDPLGLVLKAGVWYLVALSGRTRSLRTFRVSRVQSVRLARRGGAAARRLRSRRPLGRGVRSSFLGSWQTMPVLVRMRGDLLWLVRYVQDPTRRRGRAGDARPSPTPTAGSRLTLQFENLEMAGYDLMRLGGDLEVLEPVELRAHLAERAAEMVERYAVRASLTACPSPTPSSASTAVARATACPSSRRSSAGRWTTSSPTAAATAPTCGTSR